jgi:hypothetical protein
MSEEAIKTGFMGPLSAVFGPKRDPLGFVTQIVKRLTGPITAEQAQRAADLALGSGTKSWPSFDTCLRLLETTSKPLEASAPGGRYERRLALEEAKREEWSPEALQAADGLIRDPMGVTAAREGWIVGLWDFARKNRRLPDHREATGVKLRSLESRETILTKGRASPAVLAGYLDRVQRLSAIAEGLRITEIPDAAE